VEGQAEPSSGTQRGDSMAPPRKRKKQPTITEHGDLDGGDHSRGLARPQVLRFRGEKRRDRLPGQVRKRGSSPEAASQPYMHMT
jgi:hypothetical protein